MVKVSPTALLMDATTYWFFTDPRSFR